MNAFKMTDDDARRESFAGDIPFEVARLAHEGTSFSPERRADRERYSYAASLERLRAAFLRIGGDEDQAAAEFQGARERFRKLYLAYLQSRHGLVSTLIAGPANFPARRMQKKNETIDRRVSEVVAFHEKAVKRARRVLRPDLQPVRTTEGNDGADRYREKLAKLEARRDAIKAARAARPKCPILNYRASDDGIEVVNRYHGTSYVVGQIEMSRADWKRHWNDQKGTAVVSPGAHRVRLVYRGGTQSAVFLTDSKEHDRPTDETAPEAVAAPPQWSLTNLNAEIRRVRQRIEECERYAAARERSAGTETEFEFDGGSVEYDYDAGRVRIYHDEKPPAEKRGELKSRGFRWARSVGAWQRQLNGAGVLAARMVTGLELPEPA